MKKHLFLALVFLLLNGCSRIDDIITNFSDAVIAGEPFSEGLNTYSDNVVDEQIDDAYWRTLNEIEEKLSHAPNIYQYQDAMEWPRLLAVWQLDACYATVTVSMNNDNDAIRWNVEKGEFEVESLGESYEAVAHSEYILPLRSSQALRSQTP